MNVCQYLPPTYLLLRYNVGAGGISCKLYDVESAVSDNQLACDRRGILQTLTQQKIFLERIHILFLFCIFAFCVFHKVFEHVSGQGNTVTNVKALNELMSYSFLFLSSHDNVDAASSMTK